MRLWRATRDVSVVWEVFAISCGLLLSLEGAGPSGGPAWLNVADLEVKCGCMGAVSRAFCDCYRPR